METLKDSMQYEHDFDDIPELYEKLFRELKVIHSNNMVVPEINSEEIIFGKSMMFKSIKKPSNFEVEKRNNILSLSKLMIGSYLSLGTGFKDFSSVDNEWFKDNIDNIFSTMNYEDFDKEYFEVVFLEGKNYYYSDYLDRKRQGETLQGNRNVQGYKKVLRTAGSNLYEDLSDEEDIIKEKNANMQTAFNPLLIAASIAIIAVLVIMIVLIN